MAGGNEPAYYFGAHLLAFIAPPTSGAVEEVPVADPADGSTLQNENGIIARSALIAQAEAARSAIDRRIVTLGGDCLVDLAPIAYLNERYDNLGVLWIDSHPDVIGPDHFAHAHAHAHAHVLGALLGEGDPDLDRQVPHKVDPRKVMYAGLDDWSEPEGEIITRLGLRHTGAAALADTSRPILKWIAAEGIRHLAIHFDLDTLDPAHFRPLLFNRPDAAPDASDGIPQGWMRLAQTTRLLDDVALTCDVVGLAITEHLPWDVIELRDALLRIKLLRD